MIGRLIDFLCHMPSDPAAPLVVALNDPATLAMLGAGVNEVRVFDTHADKAIKAPFVLLQEETVQGTVVGSLSDGGGLYQRYLRISYTAPGKSRSEAEDRANVLKQICRRQLDLALTPVFGGASIFQLSGANYAEAAAGSIDKIQSWRVLPAPGDMPTAGPGDGTTVEQRGKKWSAYAVIRVEVYIFSR